MQIKKILKISTYSIISFIIICAIALTSVIFLINPNKFKPLIIKTVESTTNRHLQLNGNLAWSVWPNLGLKLNDVSLSNPIGFKESNMVEFNSAVISVKLLPLLNNSIAINELTVNGLKLNLLQNNGINNWTFDTLLSNESSTGATADSATKPIKIAIDELKLTNSTIMYKESSQVYAIKNINLDINTGFNGKIVFDEAKEELELKHVTVNFDDAIKSKIELEINNFANPQINGKINLDKFAINQVFNKITTTPPLPAQIKMLDGLKLNSEFNTNNNLLKLKNTSFSLNNDMAGTINFQIESFTNPKYSGNIQIDNIMLSNLLNKIKFSSPYTQNNKMLNQMKFSANFTGTKNSADIKKLSFEFPNYAKGIVNMSINNFTSPSYTGDLNIPTCNLNSILNEAKIAIPARKNNKLLDEVGINTKFSGDLNTLNLQQTELKIAKLLNIKSNTKITNFNNPSVVGDVNIAEFPLNLVLEQAGYPKVDIANPTILNKVSYKSNFSATTNSAKITNLNANLTATNIIGNVDINSFKPLTINENITINKIDVADIVDSYGYKVPLTNLHATGNLSIGNPDNYSTYSGKQVVNIDNVTVLGFSVDNLAHQLDEALTNTGKVLSVTNVQQIAHSTQVLNSIDNMKRIVANAQVKGKKDLSQKTNLGVFNGNFTINHGVVNPSNYSISGPSIKNNGSGTVNMVNKSLNYKVNTLLVAKQQNKVLNSIVFPYNVHGPFSKLDGSLDWMSIQQQLIQFLITNYGNDVKNAVKNETKKQVDNLIKQQAPQASEQIQQGAQKLINGIFGK